MKIRAAIMCSLVLLCPSAAHADPLTLFFTTALGIGAGFAAVLTSITIQFATSAVLALVAGKPQTPTIADAQVNVRLDTAPRWQLGGPTATGGAIVFAEKDGVGRLWYIVAHGDAELTGAASYILDGIPVTLSDGTDGHTAGDVLTAEFCLGSSGEPYESGARDPQFRLYTVTPSSASVYGALPALFTAAFTALPADFYLAGVCFTVVRVDSLAASEYRNVMHWRGGLGLGEPSVVLAGNFGRMYDPREPTHDIDDDTTWTASTGNSAIVWAWWRTAPYGRNRPMTEVNWTKVGEQADICDLTVLNRNGIPTPLYRTGYAFPDSKPRQECEREILASMDAFVAYDDEGLAYAVPGYYEAPDLTFTGRRDILSAQLVTVDDSEVAVDGVVVNYIDPHLGYVKTPCAPWFNTDWYDGAAIPNLLTVDILTCQDHNQAVRLAKAIGQRTAPVRKASLITTIVGILAKGQRAINLDYDDEYSGVYEIASPVEEDPSGMAASFAVVPLASDRWTLNAGEEGVPPASTPDLGITVPDTLNPVPGDLTAVTATGDVGSYTINFTTANDVNQASVSIFHGATNVFSAATEVTKVYVGPNVSSYDTETVAAGTWYVWAVPRNVTNRAGNEDGPHTVTVT